MSNNPDGPPPNDGYKYIWVKSKPRGHWRKVRGSLTTIHLNSTFSQNASLAATASPAAKQILLRLSPFMQEMNKGRFIARIAGRLRKAWNKSGCFHYSFMEGYEMQTDRPFFKLFPASPNAHIYKDEVLYHINLAPQSIKKQAKFVTGYFFELIMLSGDPSKPKKMRIQVDTSPRYNFSSKLNGRCDLRLPLPAAKTPWMVMIKVTCLEGDEVVKGENHTAMKVVKANALF